MIHILAVGRKHQSWVNDGIERYEKRLQKPWTTQWQLLSHSSLDEKAARIEESKRVLERISPEDFVILLDERGKVLDSPALSISLLAPLESAKRVVIIIGGAYGVDQSVFDRANLVWSLSKLVFPHQLVRLILIEQLYRAQEIAANRPYHHQ